MMTLGELAERYCDAWNAQEEAQHIADEHAARRSELRQEILRAMESQGMESFKTDRITLTVKEEMVPQVTNWPGIFSWIASSGRWDLIRKQLNTGPFKELIENGEALPDGLEAVAVRNLNNRRK